MTGSDILRVEAIAKHYAVGRNPLGLGGRSLRAVDGVDLTVRRGETLALVGESGCGKSTLARLMLRLIDPSGGRVFFEGREITGLSRRRLRPLRARMQLVFQDPFASLNPRMTVGTILEEPLLLHGFGGRAQRRARVAELLALVGLAPAHAARYPHEFSGGQRQRIGIARALACGPELVIGDEPVSALDVSVQAQIVNLLADLKQRLGLTLVVIAHDLAVVRQMADRVGVMYLGRLVELAETAALFENPRHPYTRALIAAVPLPDPAARGTGRLLEGDVPSPVDPPPGCSFHTRCPFADERCRRETPALREVRPGRQVACHHEARVESGPPVAFAGIGESEAFRRRARLFTERLERLGRE